MTIHTLLVDDDPDTRAIVALALDLHPRFAVTAVSRLDAADMLRRGIEQFDGDPARHEAERHERGGAGRDDAAMVARTDPDPAAVGQGQRRGPAQLSLGGRARA